MLYLGGIGLALFLDLLLISKKNKTRADKILAIWLLVMAMHTLLYYFRSAALYPQLYGMEFPFPMLHGPLLYLYTKALTNHPVKTNVALLHFAMPLAFVLYLIPAFYILPTEQKIYVFEHKGAGYEAFQAIQLFCVIGSGIGYVIWTSIVLRNHRAAIVQEYSDTEKVNLDWVRYLTYWIGAIWILVINGNDDLIFGAASLFVIFIGYFGIRQVGIFSAAHSPLPVASGAQVELENRNRADEDKQKYQKSGLTKEGAEQLHRELTLVMQGEKLYTQSELTLADLAARLGAPANYLSQVINEREGKNFYDYVNTLRIEEFKRLVSGPDSQKYTLLGLANDCGFNSKSSFNRYFKKVMGTSPSEYVRSLGKETVEVS